MNEAKLHGFSDAFFAIIITIMILELKIPETTGWAAIRPLAPVFFSYLLSFSFLGMYWGNHRQLMAIAREVTPAILWANMNLLFWISLIPFATGWMGVNHFERGTVAAYGALVLMCGTSYALLGNIIRSSYGADTRIGRSLQRQTNKCYISILLYIISVPIALYLHPFISLGLFTLVCVGWMVPDRQIEHALNEEE